MAADWSTTINKFKGIAQKPTPTYKGNLDAEFDKQTALQAQMAQQRAMNSIQGIMQGITTTGSIPYSPPVKERNFEFCPPDQKVDWGKFAMWLRGFLAGVEGKPLTAEDIAKIMEKLAYVDPDRVPSYQPKTDYPDYQQPGQFIPYHIPAAQPQWVYNDSNTTVKPQWIADAGNAQLLNNLKFYANTIDRPDANSLVSAATAKPAV